MAYQLKDGTARNTSDGSLAQLNDSASQLPASLGQGTMAESLPVVLPSDQAEVPVSMSRAYPAAALSLTYSNATTPTAFIDVRGYAGFEIGPIPAEANGLTMTPMSANDTGKTGAAVPYFYDGVTKTAMPGIAVATGDRIMMKAEMFPAWFFGLQFSGAWTGTIPVRPKG